MTRLVPIDKNTYGIAVDYRDGFLSEAAGPFSVGRLLPEEEIPNSAEVIQENVKGWGLVWDKPGTTLVKIQPKGCYPYPCYLIIAE